MNKTNAWMFFLNSNNYYLYMLIGAYYDLVRTNTHYPIYCAISEDVSESTLKILDTMHINTIKINTKKITSKIHLANVPHYQAAFSKLAILGKDVEDKFNKIVYLDTDMQFFENIDELMDKPHMSAIADEFPSKDKTKNKYNIGDSIFCSGLFVWDFKSNPNVGQNIIDNLDKLDPNIGWHDQSVLNFYYSNWQNSQELHLSATYGVMNDDFTIKLYNKLFGNAKAIHYVSRPRANWPFKTKFYIFSQSEYWYSKWVHIIGWFNNINDAIDYFKLDLEKIHIDNLIFDFASSTSNSSEPKLADGRPDCYLYF